MDEQVSRSEQPPVEIPQFTPAPPAPCKANGQPRRRVRATRLLLLLLVLAVIVGVVFWLHPWQTGQGGGHGRSFADIPQSVREAIASTGDLPVTLNALGTVTPLATVTVRTQINGQLTQIAFKEGQLVQKGDFLAQIDPRPYQAALEQAQGTLARDQALLKQAELDLARYQKLNAQDSIARQQVDTQASLVQQYLGTVQSDQAQIDTDNLNLAYCHITAPVAGRVGLRQVDQGNYVQTSDTGGIVVITQLQPISVLFTMAEDYLPQVTKRIAAGATLPVTVYDRSNTTRLADGTLDTFDNQIDVTTGTVKLRAVFANTDTALFPNQFVNARLLVDTVRDAVVVPTAAVQTGSPGTYVYLAKADGTVTVRPVRTGVTDGERVQVVSGLAAGDTVVIDGADRLREGARISVPAQVAGQGGPASGADAAGEHTHHHRDKTQTPAPAP